MHITFLRRGGLGSLLSILLDFGFRVSRVLGFSGIEMGLIRRRKSVSVKELFGLPQCCKEGAEGWLPLLTLSR